MTIWIGVFCVHWIKQESVRRVCVSSIILINAQEIVENYVTFDDVIQNYDVDMRYVELLKVLQDNRYV